MCKVVVTGELNLELNPCMPGGIANGGSMYETFQSIELRDAEGNGVIFQVPPYLQPRLRPHDFIVGDFREPLSAEILGVFMYSATEQDMIENYESYKNKYDASTLTLTEAGVDQDYISGSFSFPATQKTGDRSKWRELSRTSRSPMSMGLDGVLVCSEIARGREPEPRSLRSQPRRSPARAVSGGPSHSDHLDLLSRKREDDMDNPSWPGVPDHRKGCPGRRNEWPGAFVTLYVGRAHLEPGRVRAGFFSRAAAGRHPYPLWQRARLSDIK